MTRCYEYYSMFCRDPERCHIKNRQTSWQVRKYIESFMQHGVLFNYSDEDKKRFLDLRPNLPTERDIGRVSHDLQGFQPQLYNVWNFNGCDERFGLEDFEGRIPGQLVQNIVYYFSAKGDVVVDPMAGSGTTYDVCLSMNRKALCYDLKPIRSEIKQHDIAQGFPEETKGSDLILLDPPYFNMVFNEHKTVDEFYRFVEKLAKDSFETIRQNGRVAFLMQDMTEKGNYCLSGESYMLFRKVGFSCITHVSCPLTTQQFLPQQVEKAKTEIRMLGRNRDLYIFQKW